MGSRPQLNAKSKNSLFQKGFKTTVTGNITTPENFPLNNFCKEFFANIEVEPLKDLDFLLSNQILTNIRGRQYPNVTSKEEIISLEGLHYPEDADEEQTNEDEEKVSYPVTMGINSEFHLSHKKGEIQYKTSTNLPKKMPTSSPVVNLKNVFEIPNLNWNSLKFGLEFFKSNFLGSMLGSTPTIYKRLYLDINQTKITFLAEESSLEQKSQIPLEKENFLAILEKTLSETSLEFQLLEEIKTKLS